MPGVLGTGAWRSPVSFLLYSTQRAVCIILDAANRDSRMLSSRSAELPLSSVKAKMNLEVEGPVARPSLRCRGLCSTELEAQEGTWY